MTRPTQAETLQAQLGKPAKTTQAQLGTLSMCLQLPLPVKNQIMLLDSGIRISGFSP